MPLSDGGLVALDERLNLTDPLALTALGVFVGFDVELWLVHQVRSLRAQ